MFEKIKKKLSNMITYVKEYPSDALLAFGAGCGLGSVFVNAADYYILAKAINANALKLKETTAWTAANLFATEAILDKLAEQECNVDFVKGIKEGTTAIHDIMMNADVVKII